MTELAELTGIPQGEEIRCGNCGQIIYYAATHIPFRAEMLSSYLLDHEHNPVPKMARLQCPHCNCSFRSISTVGRVTI